MPETQGSTQLEELSKFIFTRIVLKVCMCVFLSVPLCVCLCMWPCVALCHTALWVHQKSLDPHLDSFICDGGGWAGGSERAEEQFVPAGLVLMPCLKSSRRAQFKNTAVVLATPPHCIPDVSRAAFPEDVPLPALTLALALSNSICVDA